VQRVLGLVELQLTTDLVDLVDAVEILSTFQLVTPISNCKTMIMLWFIKAAYSLHVLLAPPRGASNFLKESPMRNIFWRLLVVASVLVLPNWSHAALMYSTGGGGTQLWTIDTVTGAGTLVGATGTTATFGAAFAPDGSLYTVTDSYSTAGKVGRFNLTTGAVTSVTGAAVGVPDLMVLEFASDGTFYAASWGTNSLYTINLTTGLPTLVGALGFSGIMDLAFDSSGDLWAVAGGSLFEVDTSTGAGTFVTSIGLGCSMGIAFDSSDNLFATDYCAADSGLFRINTVTGAATLIGLTGISAPHGGDVLGASVPEPSTLLMLSVAGVGLIALRRKQPTRKSNL
jgi:WD40 repeat protein